ncbi:MAG: hypothetical protein NZM31_01025 [Gemmatales bacterium]|nr:hypothetical protein [Gemmatales bacterium]MDW8385577.1 hypothetical protein [Gemmatales bacterium]
MNPRRIVAAARSLEELEAYIKATLCSQDRLDPQQTPIRRTSLSREGKFCGVLFIAHGPRRMRCQAIWICEEHRILCYDSAGNRFAEIQLYESPEPPAPADLPFPSQRRSA